MNDLYKDLYFSNVQSEKRDCIFYFNMIFIRKVFIFFIEKMKRQEINEELTRSEIRSMITSAITDALKEKAFEKRVKELTTDAMEKFFRMMYNKRNLWKGELKNV